ncbi:hypothetical protein PR048_015387, partial [Dryococelus australis]
MQNISLPCIPVQELFYYRQLSVDACGGQNMNNCTIRFLLSLTDTNRFDIIIHRFPILGHSYLACDRDFSL